MLMQGWGFDSHVEIFSHIDPFVSELCKVGQGGQLQGGLAPPRNRPPLLLAVLESGRAQGPANWRGGARYSRNFHKMKD